VEAEKPRLPCTWRHARRKLKAAIIDIDPQGSAIRWNNSRSPERKLDAIAADATQLAALLEKAKAGGIELVFIGTAPHSSSATAIAVRDHLKPAVNQHPNPRGWGSFR
jgi:hypothetical protein